MYCLQQQKESHFRGEHFIFRGISSTRIWAIDHCWSDKYFANTHSESRTIHSRHFCIEKPIYSPSFMLFPDWNGTEVLMNAVPNAVRSCLTTLCCAAFYTVHRCFGKSDAFYNKSCSYGNKDGCLFVEDPGVCLVQTAVKSTISACVAVCLC